MAAARRGGVTGVTRRVQALAAQAFHALHSPGFLAAIAAVLWLNGCARGPSANPVDWWHGLEGGPIAGTRPPPPNANAPFPNLASVPAKPVTPDPQTQASVMKGLEADRANARYAAKIDPLPAAAPPGKPQAAAPPKPQNAEAPNASLAAASAPPPPPPKPAAVPAVAPMAQPAPAAAGATPPAPMPPAPMPPAPMPPVPMPPVPQAPPPPPALAGVFVPAGPAEPAPVAPLAPLAAPVAMSGELVAIAFPSGGAALPAPGLATVKSLAQRRGTGTVVVMGYGDAASAEPAVQSAALPLGLARARAVAEALRARGVPATAIRIGAEAEGAGATARITN